MFASGASKGLAFTKGLILARVLPPADFGVSTVLAVMLSYAQYVDLGSSTAAYRSLAGAAATKNQAQAALTVRWIFAIRFAAALLVAAVSILTSTSSGLDPKLRLGLRIFPFIVLPAFLLGGLQLAWQARGQIARMSRIMALAAFFDFVFVVVLAYEWGLPGLLVGSALAVTTTFVAGMHAEGFPGLSFPPLGVFRNQVVIGLPLVAVSFLDHNLVYIDQVIVYSFLSLHEVGIYNVALMVSDTLRTVGIAAAIVLGPRLLGKFARARGNLEEIREDTVRPIGLFACLLAPPAAVLSFVAGYGISQFYPAYADAVAPLRLLLIGFYLLVVAGGPTSFFFAIDKQGRIAVLLAFAVAGNVLLDILLLGAGFGIVGVALGSLITYLVVAVVHIGYAAAHFQFSGKDWLKLYGEAFLPAVYLVAVLMVLDFFFDYRVSAIACFGATSSAIVLLSPLVIKGLRGAQRLDRRDLDTA